MNDIDLGRSFFGGGQKNRPSARPAGPIPLAVAGNLMNATHFSLEHAKQKGETKTQTNVPLETTTNSGSKS